MQDGLDGSEGAEQPEAPVETPELETVLQSWQQGDVFFAPDLPFVHLARADRPLTPEAREAAAAEEGTDDTLLVVPVITPGLVLISQTCDVVRSPAERPYLEIAPLRKLPPEAMVEVRRGDRPQYAALPGLSEADLAVDLDRTMTIEKAVLLEIEPTQKVRGCPTEEAAAMFGLALGRKRARFAFPDDFVSSLTRIQKRIRKKHAKGTAEGQLYGACREIRVRARPTWENPTIIELWFLFDAEGRIPATASDLLDDLAEQFVPTGVFNEIALKVAALDEITAKLYVESYPLDLDHLSGG